MGISPEEGLLQEGKRIRDVEALFPEADGLGDRSHGAQGDIVGERPLQTTLKLKGNSVEVLRRFQQANCAMFSMVTAQKDRTLEKV